LAALLVHVLITLGQAVPLSALAARFGGEPGFLVTCVTYRDADQAPDRTGRQPGSTDNSSCPVCRVEALSQSLLPPQGPETAAPWAMFSIPSALPIKALVAHRLPSRLAARGPPSVV